MAISPSGRSDVYWVDGKLQVGDDFWPPSTQKHKDKTYKLSQATTIIIKKDRVEIIHFNKNQRNELSENNKVTIELNSEQLDCVKTLLDVVADELKNVNNENVSQHLLPDNVLLRVGEFEHDDKAKGTYKGVSIGKSQDVKQNGEATPLKKGVTLTEEEWKKFSGSIRE